MNPATLNNYLKPRLSNFTEIQEIKKLKGGRSNPTYLLITSNNKYVLRSQPHGKLLSTAHDMGREYRILKALETTDVPVPLVFHYCDSREILGVTFYLMEYIEGDISQQFHLPHLNETDRRKTYLNMTQALATLHKIDVQKAGLDDFGKKGNYFERQYHRWLKQYHASEPEDHSAFNELAEWLGENIPKAGKRTIVHGDYRLDNLVFAKKSRKVEAILDWELSTLGNPLSDIGYFLGILNAPQDFPFSGFAEIDRTTLGIPSEEELLELYCRESNIERIENWPFYKAFGFFRLAAIAAGIQRRVILGNAVDPMSKLFGSLTGRLAEVGLDQLQ